MIDSELTKEQAIDIGKNCKNANSGNMLIGAFSASLVNESYPLTKPMWDVIFSVYTDEELGRAFEKWVITDSVEMTETVNDLQKTYTKN